MQADRSASYRRPGDRWLIVVMIALMGIFAAALVTYVFRPAVTSMATTSAPGWSSAGP